MRDDLIGGLKNALARGIETEKAIRSFINAGYNEFEVREAAKSITQGSLASTMPLHMEDFPAPETPVQNEKKKFNLTHKIIILSCILLILVCALVIYLVLL